MGMGDLRDAIWAICVCLGVSLTLIACLYLFAWLIVNGYVN